jgi:hypothetical protein
VARKRWNIEVTAEDFNKGVTRDSNRCAVKEAVAREIPGAKRVEVDLQTIRFSIDDERHVYLTPWQVAEYIIAFDAGDVEQLHPFSFQLRSAVEIGPKVRRQTFTDEGRKVEAARTRVRKAKAKKERATEVLDDSESTTVEKAQAEETLGTIDEVIAERTREYEDVRAEAKESGMPRTKVVDSDRPRAPRKFKTRTREFGVRVLRVNQAEGRVHYSNT